MTDNAPDDAPPQPPRCRTTPASGLVDRADTRHLARMLDAHWEVHDNWFATELGAILEHQLAAPLEAELALPALEPAVHSYHDLIHHPAPPLDLLTRAKDFAAAHLDPGSETLPPEIAGVLYYGSVLVARWRCGQHIAPLNDDQLLAGIDWALGQPWLDPETRDLFQAGRASVAPPKA